MSNEMFCSGGVCSRPAQLQPIQPAPVYPNAYGSAVFVGGIPCPPPGTVSFPSYASPYMPPACSPTPIMLVPPAPTVSSLEELFTSSKVENSGILATTSCKILKPQGGPYEAIIALEISAEQTISLRDLSFGNGRYTDPVVIESNFSRLADEVFRIQHPNDPQKHIIMIALKPGQVADFNIKIAEASETFSSSKGFAQPQQPAPPPIPREITPEPAPPTGSKTPGAEPFNQTTPPSKLAMPPAPADQAQKELEKTNQKILEAQKSLEEQVQAQKKQIDELLKSQQAQKAAYEQELFQLKQTALIAAAAVKAGGGLSPGVEGRFYIHPKEKVKVNEDLEYAYLRIRNSNGTWQYSYCAPGVALEESFWKPVDNLKPETVIDGKELTFRQFAESTGYTDIDSVLLTIFKMKRPTR